MRTDTVLIPIIDGEVDTTREVGFPWGRPPVTRVYLTPRARLRRSPFVADLRRGRDRALAVLGVIAFAVVFFGGIRLAYELADIVGLTR